MCQLWLSTASCNDRSCPHLHPSVQVNAWLSSSPPPVSSALTATFFIVCCLRLGATREAARQEREERKEKCKKDKDGAGREGGGTAVGGVADSGVPTIVVINAGDDKKGTGGGLDSEQVRPEIVEKEDATEQPGADEAEVVEAGSAAAAAAATAVEAAGDIKVEEDA